MKTSKTISILILISIFITLSYSADEKDQILTAKNLIKTGILHWDEGKFYQAAGICERVFAGSKNPYAKYYQTLAQAYILQKLMVTKEIEKFDSFYETAKENAESLKEDENLKDEAQALLAHIYMSKLSLTPQEAPALSAKVHSCLNEALELNPKNPRALVIKAMMLFFTPEMFGGNPQKAIKLFEDTKPLFNQKNENELTPDWGYLDLTATLALAYLKTGNPEKAKLICEETLVKEPDYARIKFRLLPAIEKTLKESKTK